jgi:hypothetical protein
MGTVMLRTAAGRLLRSNQAATTQWERSVAVRQLAADAASPAPAYISATEVRAQHIVYGLDAPAC